ncbi:MAG: hypothetical protein WC891_05705 [Actinomycetota bacterium]
MRTSKEAGRERRVFIADDAPDAFEFLKAAVTGGDGLIMAGEARTLEGFMEIANEALADVWLVSSAWLGLLSKSELKRTMAANPEVIIIAVTDSKDFAELKAALRRGARDVIVLGASAEEVRTLIQTHCEESVNRRELTNLQAPAGMADGVASDGRDFTAGESCLVLITGGDGGTGKSFIAAQLAGIIAEHAKVRTCLVDMDCLYGSLTATLGASDSGPSLMDLVQVAEELEADQIANVITEHRAGFSLVPGAAACSCAEYDSETGKVPVRKILRILKTLFDVVICDIPQVLCDAEILEEADDVYVVATPDKTGARCAGILGRRIDAGRLIVNLADRRGAFPPAKMAELCGMPVEAAVPEDAGAGRLFDKDGEILAARTNLAITRSLIPVAQRCRHFDQLATRSRPAWLRGFR